MSDSIRVGIIGTGWVGASVAISTLHAGLAQELLLHDARTAVAEGEAMDLAHGAAFYPVAAVRHAALEEMHATDAVVIAAGRGSRPGETRLDLARENVRIARDIASHFRGYRGILIVVANPVDVLTHQVADAAGLDPARVIGTGTMLDTARLREIVGRTLHLAPQSIHAQVVGEHGDSEVVLWSGARAAGMPLSQWPGWSQDRERDIAIQVRRAAYEIIQRKGATNHAIGLVTAALLRAALRNERRVLTVSRVQDGVCGLHDVALSLPAIVGAGGATPVIEPEMSEAERQGLAASAAVLRQSLASVA